VVERPTISLAVEPPPPPARDLVAGSEPPVETGPETTPRDPVATTEPQQTPPDQPVEVVTTEPVPPPVETPPTDPPAETPVDVAATDPPVTTDPPADTLPIELPPQVVTSGASDREIMRIGEDLQIRPADPPSRPRVHHLAAGLSNGSQAFAQLKNMNFFLGRVKAMDSSFLTLDLAPGEITLAFDALNAIVPLASEEYRLMHGSAEGFVRLTNRNKLFGKILTNSLADNVVLEVQQSQVVIPRETIEEVGAHTRSTVHVLEDNDSDWIKTLLQRQAGKSSGVSAPAPQTPPPAPPGDGR
jgi:hypothetical protein